MRTFKNSIVFLLLLLTFLASCSNGVEFGVSTSVTDGSLNTEIPTTEEEKEDEETTPEKPAVERTGTHVFSYNIAKMENQQYSDNLLFSEPAGVYVRFSDKTGKGTEEATFTFTLDVPKELTLSEGEEPFAEGAQNITATIQAYEPIEGDEHDFVTAQFSGSNTTSFIFTPETNTAELKIKFNHTDLEQQGKITIRLDLDPKVYSSEIFDKIELMIFSKGALEKETVSFTPLIKTLNNDDVDVIKSATEYTGWKVEYEDEVLNAVENDFTVPMSMEFYNLKAEYPISVKQKSGENVTAKNIKLENISGNTKDTYRLTFDAVLSKVDTAGRENGKLVLEVSATNNEVYEGLPFELSIDTERKYNKIPVTFNSLTITNLPEATSSGQGTTKLLTIKDSAGTYTHADLAIPLNLKVDNVDRNYAIKASLKENSAINIVPSGFDSLSGGIITLNVTHQGVNVFEKTTGTVTIAVDSDYKNVYEGFPFDIVISTEREKTFAHYVKDYFTTSTYAQQGLHDESGYYTQLVFAKFADEYKDERLTYEITRKDDSSDSYKNIFGTTINANEGFSNKDYNALMLRSEPSYKLKITHDGTSVEVEKTGSRMLTPRELGIAAMNSIRYGFVDQGAHSAVGSIEEGSGIDSTVTRWDSNGGKLVHERDYVDLYGWFEGLYQKHKYSFTNYKPFLFTLNGSVDYRQNKNATKKTSINTTGDDGSGSSAPFRGTVNITSPYGSGSINLQDIHISSVDWDDPAQWSSGNLSFNNSIKTEIYTKDNMRFAFFDTWSEFINYIAPNGNYTQQ